MLNPRIRAKRLRVEHERLVRLCAQNELIDLEKADNDPPDRYIVRFNCRGVCQVSFDRPKYGEFHRVSLVLTASYPVTQPLIEWLTPIFHPNIRADGQAVCIGSWYPGRTLDQLIVFLGEMVQYKIYAT
jgi:ubiquitin-protein ligase